MYNSCLASKNAQRSFAQVNMEYPIMENLPQNNVVKKWGEFKANTKFNLSRAGILQKDAVKLMYEAKYK